MLEPKKKHSVQEASAIIANRIPNIKNLDSKREGKKIIKERD